MSTWSDLKIDLKVGKHVGYEPSNRVYWSGAKTNRVCSNENNSHSSTLIKVATKKGKKTKINVKEGKSDGSVDPGKKVVTPRRGLVSEKIDLDFAERKQLTTTETQLHRLDEGAYPKKLTFIGLCPTKTVHTLYTHMF